MLVNFLGRIGVKIHRIMTELKAQRISRVQKITALNYEREVSTSNEVVDLYGNKHIRIRRSTHNMSFECKIWIMNERNSEHTITYI